MIKDDCYFGVFYMAIKTIKSHEFPLKLTDLWITSVLFDLSINLLMGASLLALAKSIYYNISFNIYLKSVFTESPK